MSRFEFLLVSPVLAPVWIAGLLALLRNPALRRYRFFALAWAILVVTFLVTGGKPYYMAGMFPVLLAAGAIETDRWIGAARRRARLLWAMVALTAAVSVLLALPVLPARDAGFANGANSDVGETIGWPELAREVAVVYDRVARPGVILTSNYGEAGAIDRYGRRLGLPQAYSGHNGFFYWGPPSPSRSARGTVIAVGARASTLRELAGCRLAARIDNSAGIDNDERGEPIYVCAGPIGPWPSVWPRVRHLG